MRSDTSAATLQVEVPDGTIGVRCLGSGPVVVMIPSLGRAVDDFDDLAGRVAASGRCAVLPQPRGIDPTTAPLDGLTMFTLADDVAAVIRALAGAGTRATVLGHAFGNRVARMTATEHPDLVDGVVLLACGGAVQPAPADRAALLAVFDTSLGDAAHLAAVERAFFAPGHDPVVWSDGWHPDVAAAQVDAVRALDVAHWWEAGSTPVLVVHPEQDVISVAANAHDIVERLGARARLVTISDAGHALLPEQPDAVAAAVLSWLER